MPRPVKPRRYRSEHRREQAEQTRERVLDAAAELLTRHGFEGTSVAAVAERAGVSPETVYARFGNKRTLLAELVLRAVRGDDPQPVLRQAGPRAAAAAVDPREQLRLFAADIVRRLERAAPLAVILRGAAHGEPELAELLRRIHGYRRGNLRTFVEALASTGALRQPADDALDTVWALTSPELHQLLVRDGGWSRDRYREWLQDGLARLLLPGVGD